MPFITRWCTLEGVFRGSYSGATCTTTMAYSSCGRYSTHPRLLTVSFSPSLICKHGSCDLHQRVARGPIMIFSLLSFFASCTREVASPLTSLGYPCNQHLLPSVVGARRAAVIRLEMLHGEGSFHSVPGNSLSTIHLHV